MATVLARLHVDAEGRVTGRVPPSVPPGDYTAPIEVPAAPTDHSGEAPRRLDWPVHDCGPWPADLSLRREDLYGDDGR
jgi:hypothetical protein